MDGWCGVLRGEGGSTAEKPRDGVSEGRGFRGRGRGLKFVDVLQQASAAPRPRGLGQTKTTLGSARSKEGREGGREGKGGGRVCGCGTYSAAEEDDSRGRADAVRADALNGQAVWEDE